MINLLFLSGNSGIEALAYVVAYMLVVLFSLSIHELSHGFIAYKNGDMTPKAQGRLTLNPFKHIDGFGLLSFLFIGFGWAKPVQVNPLKFRNYKKGMFWVSVAGVISNIILAFISAMFVVIITPHITATSNLFVKFMYELFYLGMYINIALAVFNLLPIYPLDGFRMVSTFARYDNPYVVFMQKYGQIILLAIVFIGILDLIISPVVGFISSGFTGFWGLIF